MRTEGLTLQVNTVCIGFCSFQTKTVDTVEPSLGNRLSTNIITGMKQKCFSQKLVSRRLEKQMNYSAHHFLNFCFLYELPDRSKSPINMWKPLFCVTLH